MKRLIKASASFATLLDSMVAMHRDEMGMSVQHPETTHLVDDKAHEIDGMHDQLVITIAVFRKVQGTRPGT